MLLRSQWIQQGGGLATKQAYYDGIHEIADDEALIVEFPVPAECRYWQILVADDRFSTVDWVNRQSSLNDVQAHIDADGWFRGVVSKQDPGVHNWLDKADWPWGILQTRFYRANDYPEATVTKVPVAEVLEHLPAGTAGAHARRARGAAAAPTDRRPAPPHLVRLRSNSPVTTRATGFRAVGSRDAVRDAHEQKVQLLGTIDRPVTSDEPHMHTTDETHCGCGLFVEHPWIRLVPGA